MIRLIDWILGVLGLQRKISALSLDEVFILAIPRSSKWATVRKKHLQKQPICQVCGAEDNLQVHHIEPFHNDPDKELDENNLDWPSNQETLAAEPNLRSYSGGLNGPKSTGQSTTIGGGLPNLQARRQASMEESVELERSLLELYKEFK